MTERKRIKNLRLALINEAYHRKQMEYYQEEIKILTNDKGRK
jgi:hypothetical protein